MRDIPKCNSKPPVWSGSGATGRKNSDGDNITANNVPIGHNICNDIDPNTTSTTNFNSLRSKWANKDHPQCNNKVKDRSFDFKNGVTQQKSVHNKFKDISFLQGVTVKSEGGKKSLPGRIREKNPEILGKLESVFSPQNQTIDSSDNSNNNSTIEYKSQGIERNYTSGTTMESLLYTLQANISTTPKYNKQEEKKARPGKLKDTMSETYRAVQLSLSSQNKSTESADNHENNSAVEYNIQHTKNNDVPYTIKLDLPLPSLVGNSAPTLPPPPPPPSQSSKSPPPPPPPPPPPIPLSSKFTPTASAKKDTGHKTHPKVIGTTDGNAFGIQDSTPLVSEPPTPKHINKETSLQRSSSFPRSLKWFSSSKSKSSSNSLVNNDSKLLDESLSNETKFLNNKKDKNTSHSTSTLTKSKEKPKNQDKKIEELCKKIESQDKKIEELHKIIEHQGTRTEWLSKECETQKKAMIQSSEIMRKLNTKISELSKIIENQAEDPIIAALLGQKTYQDNTHKGLSDKLTYPKYEYHYGSDSGHINSNCSDASDSTSCLSVCGSSSGSSYSDNLH